MQTEMYEIIPRNVHWSYIISNNRDFQTHTVESPVTKNVPFVFISRDHPVSQSEVSRTLRVFKTESVVQSVTYVVATK